MRGSPSSLGPASRRTTSVSGSSARRAATIAPAVPPPTTTTSASRKLILGAVCRRRRQGAWALPRRPSALTGRHAEIRDHDPGTQPDTVRPVKAVVVGGGVVGLCCAYELHRAGAEVVVLERGKVGQGASRGNTGWVCPSFTYPLPGPG